MKIALLSSTGGAVAKAVLRNKGVGLDLIITDRGCGAEEIATKYGIPCTRIIEEKNCRFSDRLLHVLFEHKIDYVVVFFSRLLEGKLLSEYKYKLINFHPTLLPACPGMNGFNESIESGALTIGSTVHFIDEGVDTGSQIFQLRCNTVSKDKSKLRHTIFSQQCACLYEILRLIDLQQLKTSGKEFNLTNAIFDDNNFSTPVLSKNAYNLYKQILKKQLVE